MVKKIKIFSFATLLSLLLFTILNGSFSIATSMQSQGASFDLDEDDPIAFGTIIPDTNMYTAVSINGFNQGKFVQMDYSGNPIATEEINVPGDDISSVYPWYFDGDGSRIYTPTNNNYTDPWDVRWLNVSAFNAESATLSPFNISTVWNYYTISEGGSLNVHLNSSIPMVIDINIGAVGPKILKYDWLTDNPALPTIDSINMISPSGKLVDFDQRIASHSVITSNIFNYLLFTAQQTGIYRLLLDANYNSPTILHLEFLNINIESLNTGEITYGGVSDEIPTYQDRLDMEWSSYWYSFRGEKGDKFNLDIGKDYLFGAVNIDIWYPSVSGYIRQTGGWGKNLIYTAEAGDIYVSFSDQDYNDLYRYSLYLTKIPISFWNMSVTLDTTIKVSKYETKAVDFTIEEDSFVRIYSTTFESGVPDWGGMTGPQKLIFKDAKEITGFKEISPIETKTIDGGNFYYYYLPKGDYEFIIWNTEPKYDGVLQLSSKFVKYSTAKIPINPLTYPNHNPSISAAIEFTPDEYYTNLKEAQWVEINITEPGQYRLNTTIRASENLGVIPATAIPSAVVVYHNNSGTYTDWTEEFLDPLLSFPAFSEVNHQRDDCLFIAYPQKWADMYYEFSPTGTSGNILLYTWDGDWNNPLSYTDSTTVGAYDFRQDGSHFINVKDNNFTGWIKGCDFDVPVIDEDSYYWMAINCTNDFDQLPRIRHLTLSNITIDGDVNFYLIGESGYEYCDFWKPSAMDQPDSIDNVDDVFVINRNQSNNFASGETWILDQNKSHHMIGIEPGVYKFLIIPAYWSHPGLIKLRFAIENYMPYAIKTSYNITTNPTYHPWEIIDDVLDPEKPWQKVNYSLYSYGEIIKFNNTLVDINSSSSDGSKIFVECYGNAIDWTQLVVCINNVSSYDLYLMQNLTWINNFGPNDEIKAIATGVNDNSTFEFGVLNDKFTLIFVFDELLDNESITFKLGLSQYDTIRIFPETPITTVPGIDPVMLGVVIIVVSIISAVAVVIVVIFKKKGRI
ncbi:hypothetical protein ES706_05779 [subsurface metagenome]